MDEKKVSGKTAVVKPTNTKSASAKSTKWWTTPKTQSFIEAREALEVAYDELINVEADLRCRIQQRMACKQRNHNSNFLLQSLTHECIQFLVKQEMAKSATWQAAWQNFTTAMLAAEQATAEFRDEIEHVTTRKQSSKSSPKAAILEIQTTTIQTTLGRNSGRTQTKSRPSA